MTGDADRETVIRLWREWQQIPATSPSFGQWLVDTFDLTYVTPTHDRPAAR